MLGRACFNGASEMVTNLSMAVTTFLFNAIMMAYLGRRACPPSPSCSMPSSFWCPCIWASPWGWPRYSASTGGGAV
ncbi:hypothetical protein M5E87_07790 [Flavonifractor plautii]|nr:hypothetical protein M5E87_07790 [Flavonifractor plautii]